MGNQASLGGDGNLQHAAPGSDHQQNNVRMLMRDEPSLIVSSADGSTNSASTREGVHSPCMRPATHSTSMEEPQRSWQSRNLEPKVPSSNKSPSVQRRLCVRTGDETKLWDPEVTHLKMIREQLQNPGTHQPVTAGDFQELQRFQRHLKNSRQQPSDEDSRRLEELQYSITGLTHYQSSLLKRIWERASDREVTECGRAIFSHLLRSSNTPIHHFFNLVDMTDKEILTSSIFTQQSLNFATVLDFVISNIDIHLEKVCYALQALGERHLQLPFPIDTSHWALFTRVFEDNPPRLIFQNPEGHTVWKLMVDFTLRQMKIGYGIEETNMAVGGRHRRSSTVRKSSSSRSNSIISLNESVRDPSFSGTSKRHQTTKS